MSTNPKSDMCKQPSGQLCQPSLGVDPSQTMDPSQTLGEQYLLAARPCYGLLCVFCALRLDCSAPLDH